MKPLEAKEIEHGVYFWWAQYYPYRNLDEEVMPFLKLDSSGPWLRRVRRASFLSLNQMAARLKMAESNYGRIERSEISGNITLKNLRRCAEALDCELVYALRPKDKRLLSHRISEPLLQEALKFPPRGVGATRLTALAARMRDLMRDVRFRARQGWARNNQ